jgi:hypothetical protein
MVVAVNEPAMVLAYKDAKIIVETGSTVHQVILTL